MGKSIVTPVGRASFPYLSKLNTFGKYALTLLLPKSDPKVAEFVKWLSNAVKEEARTIAGDAGYNAAMAEFKAFKDGDNAAAFKTYRNEYAGHYVLTLGRQADFGKPCVVGRNRQPIDPAEVYAGCNVLAYIDVFGYKFGAKKSVSIGFQHVMKVGENTRFASTGVEVDKAFDDLELPEETADVLDGSPFGAPAPAAPAQPVAPKAPAAPVAKPAAVPNDPFAGV
jgi:hypothetical protein